MKRQRFLSKTVLLCALFSLLFAARASTDPHQVFPRDFAPHEGYTKPLEQPARQEVCLNGTWQFQPLKVSSGWVRDQGVPPELAMPGKAWESTPIRIPSPWNANVYGCGRRVGAGTAHPYWPDSVWFPSYPESWDGVQMGWLKRSFRVPGNWKDKRVLLHFEAVAGSCRVMVNGKFAGEHFDNFLPFDFDVSDLIDRNSENELLVGVRHPHLYDKTNSVYFHERATYADGSNLDGIVGIWQDVYLLGVPPVRITDAFVQPWVNRAELVIETTVRNDTDRAQEITISGTVSPWINDAGTDVLSAPEPKWHLGNKILTVPNLKVQVPANTNLVVTLKSGVKNELKLWSPDSPNLYGLVMNITQKNIVDTHYQRFGWREFKIQGSDLLLNGQKFQIVADILHPFGVVVHSRRNAWAWFKAIKDVGGNGVRLHAQPWPAYYQDMADEMGVVVLAEDGLFGSSLKLNFTEPMSWKRFEKHYDSMVLRDRNHPSVFGWSFGNELFAIFNYNHMTKDDRDKYYAKLTEFGRRSYKLDPTREWISCDGDEDLRGTLPVWAKHFGHGLSLNSLPSHLNKPLMVGESGGTYYAKPSQLTQFNGERAFESYAGRNEALGIDVYQNITQMARPKLAYFSASELVWFGLEHLPLGYSDFNRLPTLKDGVFFGPYEEGKPGMQPERIPPYCTTLNPGWDSSLPLYRPLAMFEAMKAALGKSGAQSSEWEHKQTASRPAITNEQTVTSIGFVGDSKSVLYASLVNVGVPFASSKDTNVGMLFVDAETITTVTANEIKPQIDSLLARRGQVLICFHHSNADVAPANCLLPSPVSLTKREATALNRGDAHSWNAGFTLSDLYFAENTQDKLIVKCGLDGDFVRQGKVVFKASNTDWSQFNNVQEDAKCAAVVLYEQVAKPAGAALVVVEKGEGSIAVSAIDYEPRDGAYAKFWQDLLRNMGVKIGKSIKLDVNQGNQDHNLLLNGPKQ